MKLAVPPYTVLSSARTKARVPKALIPLSTSWLKFRSSDNASARVKIPSTQCSPPGCSTSSKKRQTASDPGWYPSSPVNLPSSSKLAVTYSTMNWWSNMTAVVRSITEPPIDCTTCGSAVLGESIRISDLVSAVPSRSIRPV